MSSQATRSHDALFKATFASASALMGLQLFSRLFTFILNQALFRMASPKAYGTVAIQFELMLNTILFLSREGVRNALLRVTGKKSAKVILETSLLSLVLGIPLALGTSYFYARFAGVEVRNQGYFNISIGIYALAALVELYGEPLHNLAVAELRTNLRVRAEGLGITAKTLVTFLILLYNSRKGEDGKLVLLAFASGQLAYGIFVAETYIYHYGTGAAWQKESSKTTNGPEDPEEPSMLRLSLTMTSQSFVKHLLTEGDKFLLSWFSPLQDQGGYAIAVNYGSLVARIVFQPIEETLRVFFSKTLDKPSKNTNAHEGLHQAANVLVSLLSVQTAFSLFLLVFGTAYIPILVHVLLPPQYFSTSAPDVLSAWIWYIPVLAFNGGLEAFVSSAATPQDLNRQSRWMAVFSAIYILAALALYEMQLGDTSLVYANIINLSIRIIYSTQFISSFFSTHGTRSALHWSSVIPAWPVWLAAGVSNIVVRKAGERLDVLTIVRNGGKKALLTTPVLTYIGFGGSLALICLGTWWLSAGRHINVSRRVKSE